MDNDIIILERRYDALNKEFKKATNWIDTETDKARISKFENKYFELLKSVSSTYNLLEKKKSKKT